VPPAAVPPAREPEPVEAPQAQQAIAAQPELSELVALPQDQSPSRLAAQQEAAAEPGTAIPVVTPPAALNGSATTSGEDR
jgi:hypothetical protein